MSEIVLFSDTFRKINARPVAIYRLANHLREHGFNVQPIWAWCHLPEKIFNSLIKRFLNEETKVIGISATMLFNTDVNENRSFGLSNEDVKTRLALFKKLAPNAKIVVGGPSVKYNKESYLNQFIDVDYYVIGQGEDAFLNIVKHIYDPKHKLTTLTITKPYYTSDKVYPYKTFNQSTNLFLPSDGILRGEALPLEVARGCIFKCSFCAYDLTGKKALDFTKSVDILRNEFIKNYNEYGTQYYSFIDDLINDSPEKVEMILRIAESLPFRIYFDGYLRLDMLRAYPQTGKQLKDAGLIATFLGIETIDENSGKLIGKGLGKHRISETIAKLNEVWNGEVAAGAGFITGLPKSNSDTKFELMEWLKLPEQKKFIKMIKVSPLWISKGGYSDIDKDPSKFGYEISEDASENNYYLPSYNWKNEDYTFEQAFADSNWLNTNFYRDLKFGTKIGTFAIPYVVSLCEDKQDAMNILCHDYSDIFETNYEWTKYVESIIDKHRLEYIKHLGTSK